MLDLQRLLVLAGINESYQIDEAREDDAARNEEGIKKAYDADQSPGKPAFETALKFVQGISASLGMPANKSIVRVMLWYTNGSLKYSDLADLKTKLVEFEKPVIKQGLVAAAKEQGLQNADNFNSILSYPSYEGFSKMVDAILEQNLQSGKQKKAAEKLEGAEIYKGFKSNDFTVIIPKTEAASQLYGGGTAWCTSYTDKPCKFEDYNASGKIYIIFTKTAGPNDPKARGGVRKYQLHMENNEFKDSANEDVSKEDISFLSSIPQYKQFLEALIHDYYEK